MLNECLEQKQFKIVSFYANIMISFGDKQSKGTMMVFFNMPNYVLINLHTEIGGEGLKRLGIWSAVHFRNSE